MHNVEWRWVGDQNNEYGRAGCAHEVLTPRLLRAPACSLPCLDLIARRHSGQSRTAARCEERGGERLRLCGVGEGGRISPRPPPSKNSDLRQINRLGGPGAQPVSPPAPAER